MYHFSCSFDYLRITDDKSMEVGKYCGELSGKEVLVPGNYVVLTFYSDVSTERKGFWIFFTFVQYKLSKCNETVYTIK